MRIPVVLTSCVLSAVALAGCGSNDEAGGQPSGTPSGPASTPASTPGKVPTYPGSGPTVSGAQARAAVLKPVVGVKKNWTGQCGLVTRKDLEQTGFGAAQAEPQSMGSNSCGTDGATEGSVVLFGELPASTGKDISDGGPVHAYKLAGNTAFWACGEPTICYHYVVLDQKRWLGMSVRREDGSMPQADLEKIAGNLMQRLWSRIPNV